MAKVLALVIVVTALISTSGQAKIRQPNGPYIRFDFPNDNFSGDLGRCSLTRFVVPEGIVLPKDYCYGTLTASHCLDDILRDLGAEYLVSKKIEANQCASEHAVGVSIVVRTSVTGDRKISAIAVLPKQGLIARANSEFSLVLLPCGIQELDRLHAFPLLDHFPRPGETLSGFLPFSQPQGQLEIKRIPNLGTVHGTGLFSGPPGVLGDHGDSGSPLLAAVNGAWNLAGALRGGSKEIQSLDFTCSLTPPEGSNAFDPPTSALQSTKQLLEGFKCDK